MSGLSRGGLSGWKSKPINKIGRVGRYRQERKKKWIKNHPPDENGDYICYICRMPVHISIMKLEHFLPKGSTPKAIAESDNNLKPSHAVCNNNKGSRRINA